MYGGCYHLVGGVCLQNQGQVHLGITIWLEEFTSRGVKGGVGEGTIWSEECTTRGDKGRYTGGVIIWSEECITRGVKGGTPATFPSGERSVPKGDKGKYIGGSFHLIGGVCFQGNEGNSTGVGAPSGEKSQGESGKCASKRVNRDVPGLGLPSGLWSVSPMGVKGGTRGWCYHLTGGVYPQESQRRCIG